MHRFVGKRVPRIFFTEPALTVGKSLLGKYLVRKIGKKILAGKIVETECYIGTADRASHAFGGRRTERNEAEYCIGGHVYIYLVYGMYWQLNVVTSHAGVPECVLIRALEPEHAPHDIASGPGKLCRWLKLDKSFNKEDLTTSHRLWIEDRGVKVSGTDIAASPRIGIEYAGPIWSKKPWRFYMKGNSAVSGNKKLNYGTNKSNRRSK